MKSVSTFAYDLVFNGIQDSFARMRIDCLKEFARSIIKSSIVGFAGFLTEIIKKYRNE